MITTVRLAAVLSLLASVSSPTLPAAEPTSSDKANPPPIVIERAPEADPAQLQAELATARAENQRLANEVTALQAKVADLSTPVTPAPDANLAAAEKARADEATARLNTLTVGVDRLLDEKNALEAQLGRLRKTEAALREQLATAEKAAASAVSAPDMAKKLADTESKLEASLRSYSLLQAENQLLKTSSADQVRLSAELEKMRQEKSVRDSTAPQIADLTSKLADTQGKLTTALNSYSLLQRENEQLKSASSATQSAANEVAELRTAKGALESQLNELRSTEKSLRDQLATAEKAAAKAKPGPDLTAKLADAESKLADAKRSNSLLQHENEQLKAATASQASLASELEKLRGEKAANDAQLTELRNTESTLRQQLATAEKAAAEAHDSAAAAGSTSADAAKLAETESKLETTLRSFSQLQAENDRLKTAAAEQGTLSAEVEKLRKENASLQSRLDAAPQDNSSALAAVQDKLNTALRSYTLLQNENDRLKADAAHTAESAESSASKAAASAAAQISALFDELRQTQAQSTSLAAENAQLRTRLALVGNPPGSSLTSPVRPGSARADAIANTPVAPATSAPTAAPAIPTATTTSAATAPRTHQVVAGDSLAKISRRYYGTAGRWDEILNANRDIIKDENVLPIGATLRIP